MVKIIYLQNNLILIAKIEELSVSIGEPDCKLSDPFLVKINDITNTTILEPWLVGYTNQSSLKISSEKIITIVDPTELLLKKYTELIGK